MLAIAAAVALLALPAVAHAYVDDVEMRCDARYLRTRLDAACTGARAEARDCACRATYRIVEVHAAPVKWPIDPGNTLALDYRCDRHGVPVPIGEARPWAEAKGNGVLAVHVPLSDLVEVAPHRWEIDNLAGRYTPPARRGRR